MKSKEFLQIFMNEMEEVMDAHDEKKGCLWLDMSIEELTENLFEEVREFEVKSDPDHELIDIAASAYILWCQRSLQKKGYVG